VFPAVTVNNADSPPVHVASALVSPVKQPNGFDVVVVLVVEEVVVVVVIVPLINISIKFTQVPSDCVLMIVALSGTPVRLYPASKAAFDIPDARAVEKPSASE
jgi:hypothetical protein